MCIVEGLKIFDLLLPRQEKPKDMDFANQRTGEVKDGNCDNEIEKQGVIEDLSVHHSAEENPESKNGSNLLRLCTFCQSAHQNPFLIDNKGF